MDGAITTMPDSAKWVIYAGGLAFFGGVAVVGMEMVKSFVKFVTSKREANGNTERRQQMDADIQVLIANQKETSSNMVRLTDVITRHCEQDNQLHGKIDALLSVMARNA